jgi:hypothetical protein
LAEGVNCLIVRTFEKKLRFSNKKETKSGDYAIRKVLRDFFFLNEEMLEGGCKKIA